MSTIDLMKVCRLAGRVVRKFRRIDLSFARSTQGLIVALLILSCCLSCAGIRRTHLNHDHEGEQQGKDAG